MRNWLALILLIAIAGALIPRLPTHLEKWLLVPDALGLALFTIVGAAIYLPLVLDWRPKTPLWRSPLEVMGPLFETLPVLGLYPWQLLLILVSPVVGAIPGPGGIIVFAAGLAMVLRTSRWARRQYVRFKRWQPEAGRWTDWGLRRRSARRREARLKEQKEAARVEKASQGD